MQKRAERRGRKIKAAVLTLVTMGMVYSSPCTVADLGLNIVNGTLSFVKGYTGDLWEALVPPADQLLGGE